MKEFFKDKNLKSHPILNILELFVLLLVLWFVMSGIFETKFIIFGVTSCVIITLICVRVMVVGGLKTESTYFVLNVNYFKFFIYFLWLVKEIIKAAIYVSKISLFKAKKINPQVVWFKADYDNPVAAALLANSITLTPGTITVDIFDNGIFSVHALDDSLAEGVLSGDMQARVAKVYGETINFEKLDPASAEKKAPAKETSTKKAKTTKGKEKK